MSLPRGPHQTGRRRRIPRRRIEGQWFGYGPEAVDAVSGWLFPVDWMVPQRGGLVSSRPSDGSLDFEKEW